MLHKAALVGPINVTRAVRTIVLVGLQATCTDAVRPRLANISIEPSEVKLGALGDTVRLRVRALDDRGREMDPSSARWYTANPAVATVDNIGGLASAVGNGSTQLSVRLEGQTRSATIVVAQRVATITVTAARMTLPSFDDTVTATAILRDARQNEMSATVAWVSSDPSVVTVHAAQGTITARDNGTATITASADTATSRFDIEVKQVVAKLAIRVQPSGARAGEVLGTQPVIETRDANGHIAVRDSATPVTVSLPADAGQLTGTSVTAMAGVARFTDLAISGTAGERSLTFAADGLASVVSQPFPLVIGRVSPTMSVMSLGRDAIAPRETTTVRLQTKDAAGNALTSGGSAVVFDASTAAASVTASVDHGDGTYSARVAGAAPGIVTIGARVDGASVDRRASLSVRVGAPALLSIAGGDAQTAVTREVLPAPLSVRVDDAFGNPVSGARVAWSSLSGGGSGSPAASETNALGVATTVWTLGPDFGEQRVSATIAGVSLTPAVFRAGARFRSQDTLATTLDASAAVSRTIGDAGGALALVLPNGVRVTLDIPAGAVDSGRTITITPVRAIAGAPLSGGLIAAVQMEPDGLVLRRAATLTFELPADMASRRLMGFGYRGTGGGHDLHLAWAGEGATRRLTVSHFSGGGLAGWTTADCELQGTPTTAADRARQTIAVILCRAGGVATNLTADDRQAIERALITWFSKSIYPSLVGAENCWNAADCVFPDAVMVAALAEFTEWDREIQSLHPAFRGVVPLSLADAYEGGRVQGARSFAAAIQRYELLCLAQLKPEDRLTHVSFLQWLQRWIDSLSWTELDPLVSDPAEDCGFIVVEPAFQVLTPSQGVQFTAHFTDVFGNDIGSQPVTWRTSDASITRTDGLVHTSGAPGWYTVIAEAGRKRAWATIAVPYPARPRLAFDGAYNGTSGGSFSMQREGATTSLFKSFGLLSALPIIGGKVEALYPVITPAGKIAYYVREEYILERDDDVYQILRLTAFRFDTLGKEIPTPGSSHYLRFEIHGVWTGPETGTFGSGDGTTLGAIVDHNTAGSSLSYSIVKPSAVQLLLEGYTVEGHPVTRSSRVVYGQNASEPLVTFYCHGDNHTYLADLRTVRDIPGRCEWRRVYR